MTIENTERVRTLADLRDLITELRVKQGMNETQIAAELERRKVQPLGWSKWRVQCLVVAFRTWRKWGRKPSRAKRVWREEVEPNIQDLTDDQRAEFYLADVVPAAKTERHLKSAVHRAPRQPRTKMGPEDYEWLSKAIDK